MADALLNWLIDINSVSNEEIEKYTGVESAATVARFLADCAPTFELMLAYLDEHFDDAPILKPFLAQLLYSHKRGGPLRVFALQFIPTLIHGYLTALSQRRTDCMHLDAFLLCTYNREIMDTSTMPKRDISPDSPLKRTRNQLEVSLRAPKKDDSSHQRRRRDVVRVPNLRQFSIYHDPGKLAMSALADSAVLARLTPPTCTGQDIEVFAQMQATVTIGPFPMCSRITAENRYAILARLCRSVYEYLAQMHHDAVLLAICDLTVCLCRNGFAFGDTDLAGRVLQRAISHHQPGGGQDLTSDRSHAPMHRRSSLRLHRGQSITTQRPGDNCEFGGHPRMKVSSGLLLQLLNAVYYALFNGYHEVALEALDALHQRAKYELLADVLLVSSAVINSLLENPSGGPAETTDPMGVRIQTAASEQSPYSANARSFITNASLRMRRMPEDIPIVDNGDHPDGQSGDRNTPHNIKGDLPSKFRKMVKLRPDALLTKQKSRHDKDDDAHPHHHNKSGPISAMKGAARTRLLHMRHRLQGHASSTAPQIIQEAPSESNSGEITSSPPMTPQQRIDEIRQNVSTPKIRTESEPTSSPYEKVANRPVSDSDPNRQLKGDFDETITDLVLDSLVTRDSTDDDDARGMVKFGKRDRHDTPRSLYTTENGDGIEMRTLRHADSSTDNLSD